MATIDGVAARIRGEYREMPGLQLTLAQACRLWQLDRDTCATVLDALVMERFLKRIEDGTFVALSAASSKGYGGAP